MRKKNVSSNLNFQITATNMGTVALVGIMNWRLLLPLIILVIITVKIRQTYLETARDVKRLEATSIFLSCFHHIYYLFDHGIYY